MQPVTLRIQRDCALGETLQAEVHVDMRDQVKSEQTFKQVAAMLDRRLIELNFRVAEAMQLEIKYGPETAARVRGVIEVLLGQKSLAEWQRQGDLAPAPGQAGLQVIEGGKPAPSKLDPPSEEPA